MSYTILPLDNYPDNSEHLVIRLHNICTITLGLDIWYWINASGEECKTDTNKWWVHADHQCINYPKAFKTHEAAVKYARTQYLMWCRAEMVRMKEELKGMSDLYAVKEEIVVKSVSARKGMKYKTKNWRSQNT